LQPKLSGNAKCGCVHGFAMDALSNSSALSAKSQNCITDRANINTRGILYKLKHQESTGSLAWLQCRVSDWLVQLKGLG
jgi:hypothetical protein